MHPQADKWERAMNLAENLKRIGGDGCIAYEYVPLQANFGSSDSLIKYEPWQEALFAGSTHFLVDPEKFDAARARIDVNQYRVIYDNGTSLPLNTNELVAKDLVNFKDWTCFIGIDQLFIDATGQIRAAGCAQGHRIGHIFDENLHLPTSTVTCKQTFCPCGTDIQTRKYSNTQPHRG